MAFEDPRSTSLTLSLFSHLEPPQKQYSQLDQLTDLSLALSSDASKVHAVFKPDMILNRQASSISVVSSGSSSVKRTRDASWEEVRIKKVSQMKRNVSSMSHSEEGRIKKVSQMKRNVSSMSHSEEGDDQEIEEEGGVRKKLRLSKQQALVLEDNFREHITLNPKQKQALAEQLNLSARQVEVWFQNRRARTKLKQTEVDCELLKKFCETLTDENRKLQREVQELKALKRVAPPYYKAQLPAATLRICPSCEKSRDQPALRHHQASSKPQFSINSTKKQFYGLLSNHSSAAC